MQIHLKRIDSYIGSELTVSKSPGCFYIEWINICENFYLKNSENLYVNVENYKLIHTPSPITSFVFIRNSLITLSVNHVSSTENSSNKLNDDKLINIKNNKLTDNELNESDLLALTYSKNHLEMGFFNTFNKNQKIEINSFNCNIARKLPLSQFEQEENFLPLFDRNLLKNNQSHIEFQNVKINRMGELELSFSPNISFKFYRRHYYPSLDENYFYPSREMNLFLNNLKLNQECSVIFPSRHTLIILYYTGVQFLLELKPILELDKNLNIEKNFIAVKYAGNDDRYFFIKILEKIHHDMIEQEPMRITYSKEGHEFPTDDDIFIENKVFVENRLVNIITRIEYEYKCPKYVVYLETLHNLLNIIPYSEQINVDEYGNNILFYILKKFMSLETEILDSIYSILITSKYSYFLITDRNNRGQDFFDVSSRHRKYYKLQIFNHKGTDNRTGEMFSAEELIRRKFLFEYIDLRYRLQEKISHPGLFFRGGEEGVCLGRFGGLDSWSEISSDVHEDDIIVLIRRIIDILLQNKFKHTEVIVSPNVIEFFLELKWYNLIDYLWTHSKISNFGYLGHFIHTGIESLKNFPPPLISLLIKHGTDMPKKIFTYVACLPPKDRRRIYTETCQHVHVSKDIFDQIYHMYQNEITWQENIITDLDFNFRCSNSLFRRMSYLTFLLGSKSEHHPIFRILGRIIGSYL